MTDISKRNRNQEGSNKPPRRARKDSFVLIVAFSVGNEECGVDLLQVREISKMPALARLPGAPEYVDGVISLQGKAIPVVNLRRRFGLPRKEWDGNARIIIVERQEKQIGFLVEALQEIVRVPVRQMETRLLFREDMKADYVTAVGKVKDRKLNLLDLKQVFHHEASILDLAG
jgi:purine-binding chemotaxis protein CheW